MSEKRIKVWVQKFPDRPHLVLQWHDPLTGKRKSKSAETADPKRADELRADHEAALNEGRYAEASRMSWQRFRELFEAEYLPHCRPATQDNYHDTLNEFERACSPRTIRGVTERLVSAFAAALRKEGGRSGNGREASTIKVRLQFLHTALKWAERQKLIPACPTFPVVKVPKKRPQPVPAESFEKLLDKAPDPQMRAYLLCGWLAGLRLHEARLLEWEETQEAPWVDFNRNRIWLPAGFVKAVEDQWVPLDPVLREALEQLPRTGRQVFRFVDRITGKEIGDVALSHRVVALAKLAGVRLTMKSLRKGFGCRYAGKVPAQVLQRLMRHSNIAVTMSYYANVDAAVEEAVLGPSRNDSRNTGAVTPAGEDAGAAANLLPDMDL